MKSIALKLCYSFFLFLPFIPSNAQEKSTKTLQLGGTYIGDVVSNLNGGIKSGITYLGMATVNLDFDTENAKFWKGGKLFVKIANTHGGKPTQDLVGDFQGVSNIEAGNLTWLYECWYSQTIGNFTTTIGLQDLNVNFAADECAAVFSNSSFGIQSSIADNIPSPIFPLTALGFNLKWQITKSVTWQAALFDGTPDDFENNPYNLHWQLTRDQGFLAVSELHFNRSLIKDKIGSYKLGIYYHQHNDSIEVEQQNRGLYFVGSQSLSDKLTIFSQIGISPKTLNEHNHYYSLGFKYSGFSESHPEDFCGVAVAYAGIDNNPNGGETAIELTYQNRVTPNIYIRPDIQYIVNPAGTGMKLKNALVAMFRFGVEF